jgi:hypothetical protein
MIRGIGPVFAKKLLNTFSEKVFDIIEAEPDRLREVDGIGPVRAGRIIAAWAEQKVVREIMVFLHSHGVGTARAVRIYKTYGADAVQVMSENPYRLARDIRGIGFKTADAIAMKLGVDKTALVRVRAGISYALIEAMDEGLVHSQFRFGYIGVARNCLLGHQAAEIVLFCMFAIALFAVIAILGQTTLGRTIHLSRVVLILAVFHRSNLSRHQERVWRAQRPGAKIDAIATSAGGRDCTFRSN